MSVRFFLKEATAEAHERLDDHFGRFDLSDRDDYRSFLTAHAAALLPVETALDSANAATIVPEWPQMRRSALILADRDALGATPGPLVAPPDISSAAQIVGALYVLEGSRLGGSVLERAVGAGLPAAYLRHRTPLPWPQFVARIERRPYTDVDRREAADAANSVFAAFLSAAGVMERSARK